MGMPLSDETVILLAVIVLLAGLLRWSFGGGSGRAERRLARARDYGLLREVATTHSDRAARFVQERLRHNGIRATTAPGEDGETQRVLVFPADARRAADILLRDDD